MCSTKMSRATIALAVLMAGAGLTGCLQANRSLSSDFGAAVKQNLAAQVADPEAVYARTLDPASDGSRAADAADRYFRGVVKQPVAQATSRIGGAGAGAGAGAAPAASGGQ